VTFHRVAVQFLLAHLAPLGIRLASTSTTALGTAVCRHVRTRTVPDPYDIILMAMYKLPRRWQKPVFHSHSVFHKALLAFRIPQGFTRIPYSTRLYSHSSPHFPHLVDAATAYPGVVDAGSLKYGRWVFSPKGPPQPNPPRREGALKVRYQRHGSGRRPTEAVFVPGFTREQARSWLGRSTLATFEVNPRAS
jgi:hypothetical protein